MAVGGDPSFDKSLNYRRSIKSDRQRVAPSVETRCQFGSYRRLERLGIIIRDLRIGNFLSNRISNRIGSYDSNSNRISNRIGGSRLHVQCRLSYVGVVCDSYSSTATRKVEL